MDAQTLREFRDYLASVGEDSTLPESTLTTALWAVALEEAEAQKEAALARIIESSATLEEALTRVKEYLEGGTPSPSPLEFPRRLNVGGLRKAPSPSPRVGSPYGMGGREGARRLSYGGRPLFTVRSKTAGQPCKPGERADLTHCIPLQGPPPSGGNPVLAWKQDALKQPDPVKTSVQPGKGGTPTWVGEYLGKADDKTFAGYHNYIRDAIQYVEEQLTKKGEAGKKWIEEEWLPLFEGNGKMWASTGAQEGAAANAHVVDYAKKRLAELKSPPPIGKPVAPKPAIPQGGSGVLAPVAKPSPEPLPEDVSAHLTKALATVSQQIGLPPEKVRKAIQGSADPTSTQGVLNAATRSQAMDAMLVGGHSLPDAIHHILNRADPAAVANLLNKIGAGPQLQRAHKEYASTPLYDLSILSSVKVKDEPVSGQATCNLSNRSLKMGTTSVTGDFRHELGHAIRSAMGGSSPSNKTAMTKAVADEYKKTKARIAADPPKKGEVLTSEDIQTRYGGVGKRSIDNWEELCAEHYRCYHREIYRDRVEGGNGKFLAQYRKRHPGWAKIFDAWYTTALLGHL